MRLWWWYLGFFLFFFSFCSNDGPVGPGDFRVSKKFWTIYGTGWGDSGGGKEIVVGGVGQGLGGIRDRDRG